MAITIKDSYREPSLLILVNLCVSTLFSFSFSDTWVVLNSAWQSNWTDFGPSNFDFAKGIKQLWIFLAYTVEAKTILK